MQQLAKHLKTRNVFITAVFFLSLHSCSFADTTTQPTLPIKKRPSPIRIKVQVDPRVELYSIVFYLTGEPLLSHCKASSYQRDVDNHFSPYKNLPAIQHAAEVQRQYQIIGWNTLGFATSLTNNFTADEKIPYRNRQLEPLINEIRDFAEKSHFRAFFAQHRNTYAKISRTIQQEANKKIHREWFDNFFGPHPNKSFMICPNILLGTSGACSSSPETKEGHVTCYAIMGIFSCDDEGIPMKIYELNLVHEFIHSYTTPLIDKYFRELRSPAQKIFAAIQTRKGKSTFYSRWDTMLYESFTDACRARYRYKYEGPRGYQEELEKSRNVKFLLNENLTNLLAEYEAQRDKYPTFEDFFPKIVEFYNTQTDLIIQELDNP
jgi:hypothetical protein